MATRAATFTSKIRNLKDYHYRVTNNLAPQPTGLDIANTLKYFSQSLLSVLKDVPNIPAESYGPRQRDSVRLSIFPNLNYTGLYQAVLTMIDLVPAIQIGQLALAESILNVLGCLVPFLEHDLLDSLPYTVASTLAIFPPTSHKDIIDLLCSNLLPMTLGFEGLPEATYASESAAAIITMVFQHTDNGAFHSQIMECFMSMKKDVIKDILSIIAYGPPAARAPAANLLFYYWPQLNPVLADRRGLHYKYSAWPPVLCQKEGCVNSGNCQAVKMCLNPALAIHSGDKPPPLYICSDCVNTLDREDTEYMMDILLPMSHVSTVCENKNCDEDSNLAICTCFSIECASFNGNRPIRYCYNCHAQKHGSMNGQKHIFHCSLDEIWDCSLEVQRYLMDAIVSLLKEAQPLESKRVMEMEEHHQGHHMEMDDLYDLSENTERKLLSRYGIWLLVELCAPQDDIPIEILGHLLGMLFQWFDATAYLPDDNVGNALERLKPEYIHSWIHEVKKDYFEVIVSCLLPHPVEYARVGGYWDTLATRTTQIKEGLNCFFCLVPYDIISFEMWDYVMPYWLEAIRTEVPADELPELKVLLSKCFDIDMCPLPFKLDKMYHFVEERFCDRGAFVQEQALQWLQILATLHIVLPMHMVLEMFKLGVQHLFLEDDTSEPKSDTRFHPFGPSLSQCEDITPPLSPEKKSQPTDQHDLYDRETELVLPCFIMMLDLCLKQQELQECSKHLGIYNDVNRSVMSLLTQMLSKPWDGTHTCSDEQPKVNCTFCQNIALWHHLMAQMMESICPRYPIRIPAKEIPKVEELKKLHKADGKNDDSQEDDKPEPQFDMSDMPDHIQLFHVLLQELESVTDTDGQFSIITALKYLVLHGETLNYSITQYPDYIKYMLANKFLPGLWNLLQAEHSQLAFVAVPLILHCLTLQGGSDIVWNLVEGDFNHENWKIRFAAVEKVAVLARLLDGNSIRHNQVIQTTLAHALCHLIGSLEDINAAVAQRSIQYLETISSGSIRSLCWCLEFQFDNVISDRSMILRHIHLFSNVLQQYPILSWEFFLSRFDTLSLEAQIDLETSGDIAYPTDLTSSDRDSDSFLKKLNRARFAMARTDSVRSVSVSLTGKPPYRRAQSVPLHLLTRTLPPKFEDSKEKSYMRQQSAPQFNLGRRRSKYNLGSFSSFMFPSGQLREFTDGESNFSALLQRAMDLEGVDRDTVYQLVALLMKFMVRSDQEKVNSEKSSNKAQNIVLRHLNVLLGYNQTDKSFSVPPYKLRCSAVFNSFLSGVPFVLDKNFTLGNMLLPITLALLQYSPSPQRYASDFQPPNYTLWQIEPHTRLSWLMTLLTILYKYPINASPTSAIIQTLVKLVINTVDAQHHKCKPPDDTFVAPSPSLTRSRDASRVSTMDLEQIEERETPPTSPKNAVIPEEPNSPEKENAQSAEAAVASTSRKEDVVELSSPPGEIVAKYRKGVLVEEFTKPSTPVMTPCNEIPSTIEEEKESEADSEEESSSEQEVETAVDTVKLKEKHKSSPVTVEKKIAQQLREFETAHDIKNAMEGGKMCNYPTSESGSTLKDTTSTTQSSGKDKDTIELESTEDSEKTSDADSDKQQQATDSDEKKEENVKSPQVFKANYRQRKARKTGLTTVELQKAYPELEGATQDSGSTHSGRKSRKSAMISKNLPTTKKQIPLRFGENYMIDRCLECNAVLEQYDEDTIGLCITVLATFIHRDPASATPMLLEMLLAVGRVASSSPYSWQTDSNLIIPGNSVSAARQFLRCALHQLAPNGIFLILFQCNLEEPDFMKTMANALVDFSELTSLAPLQFLMDGVNAKKNIPPENITQILTNLSTYMNCISLEASTQTWTPIIGLFDIFFHRLPSMLPTTYDPTPILKIVSCILRVPGVSNCRNILEPMSKLLSFIIENSSFKLQQVLDICALCNRAFTKERDKLFLTRTVVFELMQALKFKSSLPDDNFLFLVQFVILDAGGTIASTNIVGDVGALYLTQSHSLLSSCAAECMRQHLNDCMEFIADIHTLTKVKNNMKGGTSLNEDTLGIHLKSGISQLISLEITRANGRDNKAIARSLPWLFHQPSAMQQGPKEFIDCVEHIRLLSWILIGSLTHTAVTNNTSPIFCLPVPLDASCHIADHILVIMTGFVEQSKTSVLHMSSLFHAFILCQLWTMYCETAAAQHLSGSDQHQEASMTIMDFWARVTPGALQLLSHSKVMAEMVSLHFVSLMEALQECNSSVLTKLFPMWRTILFSYHSQLPGHLQVRLQNCQNLEPPNPLKQETSNSVTLLSWLKRIEFKLGQIESQSSAATQFYTV